MNPVLRELEETQTTELPTGERVRITSHVAPGSGSVIRRAVELSKPTVAVEVGLAFGVSTLYILDALSRLGQGRLIGMDPAQNDATWRGGGLHNVRRAGHADRYEFHEASSQSLLPLLASQGLRIQFGFIDGWHTFDHTLVDFFFLDRMLDAGGVVVIDDVAYPSLRRLCHFIVTNRDYVLIDRDPSDLRRSVRSRLKRISRRLVRPAIRDDLTPSQESLALEAAVDESNLISLQKRGDDGRRFDHFVPF